MTARSTFNASTAAAEATKTASKSAAMVAYTNSVASGTSVQVAQATLSAALLNAEMVKQVAIEAAKDTLRSTGDVDIV